MGMPLLRFQRKLNLEEPAAPADMFANILATPELDKTGIESGDLLLERFVRVPESEGKEFWGTACMQPIPNTLDDLGGSSCRAQWTPTQPATTGQNTYGGSWQMYRKPCVISAALEVEFTERFFFIIPLAIGFFGRIIFSFMFLDQALAIAGRRAVMRSCFLGMNGRFRGLAFGRAALIS